MYRGENAVRANILYPLQKMSGSKHYIGRPASYCGFLERVARPVVGGGRRRDSKSGISRIED